MQAPDEHTKAYQNSMNERVKRRTAAAGPSRTGFHFQDRKPDGLSLLGPPGSQDLEVRSILHFKSLVLSCHSFRPRWASASGAVHSLVAGIGSLKSRHPRPTIFRALNVLS